MKSDVQRIRSVSIAAFTLLAAICMFAAFCAPHAFATPLEVRYRHPGGAGTVAYEAALLCEAGGCTTHPQPCAPGATCAITVDRPSGDQGELWLVAAAGDLRSEPSNRRTVYVSPPEGCAWDSDSDGWVASTDFASFLGRFFRREVNLVDFAAFMRVFGGPCADG